VLYRGLPVPVAIFAVIALCGTFALNNTRFGRRLYALGGNEDAARLSGINVFQTKLIVYTTISVLASLSGILLASRLSGASPNLGEMFELDVIAAVVIGGTSLAGGSGTIGGTVIGALIIGVLNNGMSLLGVSTFYQLIIKGFIIILAVWFDVLQKRK
jgi:D-xylose transport system permease protein